jgi:hypothetical protein
MTDRLSGFGLSFLMGLSKEEGVEQEMWGWIGAVVGTTVGTLGGILGTYYSIKNTKGPRERAFWLPYTMLLTLGIVTGNRRWQRIRQQESGRDAPP